MLTHNLTFRCCCFCFFSLAANVLQLPEGGDFEARTCQTVTQFIRCNALEISTIRQMHYTRCCAFGVLFRLYGCRQFGRAVGQTHSLTSFGRAVGFLSDLAMCVAVKRGLYVSLFQSLCNFLFVQMFLKFYK